MTTIFEKHEDLIKFSCDFQKTMQLLKKWEKNDAILKWKRFRFFSDLDLNEIKAENLIDDETIIFAKKTQISTTSKKTKSSTKPINVNNLAVETNKLNNRFFNDDFRDQISFFFRDRFREPFFFVDRFLIFIFLLLFFFSELQSKYKARFLFILCITFSLIQKTSSSFCSFSSKFLKVIIITLKVGSVGLKTVHEDMSFFFSVESRWYDNFQEK